MTTIVLAQSVGAATVEILTCTKIQLPSYAPMPAGSLSIIKTPAITTSTVVPDAVIFNGTLTKAISFVPGAANPGYAPTSLAGACGGIISQTSASPGQTTVVIAFNGFAKVPGALPGDTASFTITLEGEVEEPLGVTGNTFPAFLEKALMRVVVTVTRDGYYSVTG